MSRQGWWSKGQAISWIGALLVAGCLDTGPDLGAGTDDLLDAPSVIPLFEQDHDHLDPALHDFAENLELLAYHNLVPGSDGADAALRGNWLTSEIIIRGTHAYVGYLGSPWRFAIVDISDASSPKLVSAFETGNAWTMDLAVSEDGDWVYVSQYSNAVGTLFFPDYLLQESEKPTGLPIQGVLVVDARDRTRPVASGFLPIHGLGPHTAVYHRFEDGREYIFANKADAPGGNNIVIAQVVPTPTGGRTLEPVSTFQLDAAGVQDFPHDVDVETHPVTGRTLLYAAWWNQGLVIVDVSDPARPTLVSKTNTVPNGEEVQFHDTHPFPRLVNGSHYTFTAPEIPAGETSGHLRIWNTTDPAHPVAAGSWILPGDYVSDRDFAMSTHNFQFMPDGKVALGHGHAGIWIVDWLGPGGELGPNAAYLGAPRGIAYYLPHPVGAHVTTWDPVLGAPWIWGTAIDQDGNVWAADVANGLVGLRLSLPPVAV